MSHRINLYPLADPATIGFLLRSEANGMHVHWAESNNPDERVLERHRCACQVFGGDVASDTFVTLRCDRRATQEDGLCDGCRGHWGAI